MDNEYKANYYAIIPAHIRYNNDLKFAERLLYGEITALSTKEGYCFASNRYFASLYNVSISTISRWISHLAQIGSIDIKIIRNEKNEIIERRLYIIDNAYMQKNQYHYVQNEQYPICKKVKDNNIKNNIINKDKIDRLFNYIVDNKNQVPKEFEKINFDEVIIALEKYQMLYAKKFIEIMSLENLTRIKEITYVIALIVKNGLFYLTSKVNRNKLIQIYNECKNRQNESLDTENPIENFINYYYKSVENELLKD